jgi:DNA-binding HxlR family transcriptional regulator
MAKHVFKNNTAHLPAPCRPAAQIISLFADKWTLLVVGALIDGRMRFSELHSHINGISQRMLTLTLRALERDGLVTRMVYASVPPRVEYELTARGRSLKAPLAVLAEWAEAHIEEIEEARRLFDAPEE